MKYTLSLQKIAHFLIILGVFIYVSIAAKSIILPLVFAALFAFLLKPLCTKIEAFIASRITAVLLSFVCVFVPLTIIILLFSLQFADVFSDLPAIGEKLKEGINGAFLWVNDKIGFTNDSTKEWMRKNGTQMMEAPIAFLGQSISSSTALITSFFLCCLYTFFLLLYRSSIKQFVLIQFHEDTRAKTEKILLKIQTVIQKYLSGIGLVMLILAVMNTFGLWLIGIDYPLFWGFLAAFLAIIPYVGTFIGGFLPFAYSMATSDDLIQPTMIVLLFAAVQALEGNIITPKVVGSSVKINPLAAILALVTGGFLWGVAGLILSLPLIAVLRIVMAEIDFLKPLSVLLSNDIYGNSEVFEKKFDNERFRIWNYFKRKKNIPKT